METQGEAPGPEHQDGAETESQALTSAAAEVETFSEVQSPPSDRLTKKSVSVKGQENAPPSPPDGGGIPSGPTQGRWPIRPAQALWGIIAAFLFLALTITFLALLMSVRNAHRDLIRTRSQLSARLDALNARVITTENRLNTIDEGETALRGQVETQRQALKQLKAQSDTLMQELVTLQEDQSANSQKWQARVQAFNKRLESVQEQLDKATLAMRADMDKREQALKETFQAQLQENETSTMARLNALRLELTLMRAARQAIEARIHLQEKSPGLAKRNLNALLGLLKQAQSLTTDQRTREDIQQLRRSVVEIRGILEKEIFPVTTVELLVDRIDEIIHRVASSP